MVKQQFPAMLGFKSFEVEPVELRDGLARVTVVLFVAEGPPQVFAFILSRQQEGPYLGCWLTEGVEPMPLPRPAPPNEEDLGPPV